MITVNNEQHGDLTHDEQEQASGNGCGKEDANYLRIKSNGVTVALYSDAMEPEDARFSRDLGWIKDAIENAYAVGVDDGKTANDRRAVEQGE